VHAQGGLAIAAHPGPQFHGYDDDATLAQLDGTEAAHPAGKATDQEEFAAFFERARRLKPGIAPIGSSDFHFSPALGLCHTPLRRSGAGEARRARPAPGRSDPRAGWRRLSLVLAWSGVAGVLILRGDQPSPL
jgi:hypothetical protein